MQERQNETPESLQGVQAVHDQKREKQEHTDDYNPLLGRPPLLLKGISGLQEYAAEEVPDYPIQLRSSGPLRFRLGRSSSGRVPACPASEHSRRVVQEALRDISRVSSPFRLLCQADVFPAGRSSWFTPRAPDQIWEPPISEEVGGVHLVNARCAAKRSGRQNGFHNVRCGCQYPA